MVDGTIAVASPLDNSAALEAGAVELFARNGGWVYVANVTSSDADAGDRFGTSLALAPGTVPLSDRLISGAVKDDETGTDDGAAYVLELEHTSARVYCTSKRNSLGCVPRAGFTGVPSATNASPFTISAASVLNQRPGVCFYSLNGRSAAPYKGGIKCFASPYRRAAGTLTSGGTPLGIDDCTGVLALDFNAWIQSGVDPSLIPGAIVNAQFLARDGAASFGLSLTEALEFEIEP